jgi:hypothetical protein
MGGFVLLYWPSAQDAPTTNVQHVTDVDMLRFGHQDGSQGSVWRSSHLIGQFGESLEYNSIILEFVNLCNHLADETGAYFTELARKYDSFSLDLLI